MNNVIGITAITVYIVIVFLMSEFLVKKDKEISRKFVHIMLSNIWFYYLAFIDSIVWACVLPAVFVVINAFSYKFKVFKTIEREKNDGFGTVYYVFSILLICIFTYLIKNPLVRITRNFDYGLW